MSSELPPDHPDLDHLARCFNTALIFTRAETPLNLTHELKSLMDSSAYRHILEAMQKLAATEGITETQAAEKMVAAFRKVDQIWSQYVFMEGLSRLKDSS